MSESMFRLLLAPREAEGGGKPKGGKAETGKAAEKPAAVKAKPPVAADEEEIDGDELDEDDELEDEDDDDDVDDDEEDDDDDDEDDKAAKAPKKAVKAKSKVVQVSARELEELRAKAQDATVAADQRRKAAERLQQEKEEKLAAKDGLKAVERTRRRLQREIDAKNQEIVDLRDKVDAQNARLQAKILNSGFDEAVQRVADERGLKLRDGSLKHLRASLRDQFEAREDEDTEDDYMLVHKQTGKSIDDVIGDVFEDKDYAVFFDNAKEGDGSEAALTEGARKPARAVGANRRTEPRNGDVKKPSTYVTAYKQRQRELEESEGYKPPLGLSRPAGK